MSNIGNLNRSSSRTGSESSRISNVGKTKTRSALDIITGNNGTFGNLSTTGAGGFDLDVPQVDANTSNNNGGTSFFVQQRKQQKQFDTIYGNNQPKTFQVASTAPNTNQSNTQPATAPNIIIDNTPKPKPTTTTLQFGTTNIPNLNNNKKPDHLRSLDELRLDPNVTVSFQSNKPYAQVVKEDGGIDPKKNNTKSSPFLNMNGLQIGSNAPGLTSFTTQTGTGVGQAAGEMITAQQQAINDVFKILDDYEKNRTNRMNQEERYNRGQAWGRENEVARLSQQNNITGAREQNRLQESLNANSDARSFERERFNLNMQMSNNAAQRVSDAGRAMLDARTSRYNQRLVTDANRDIAETQANAQVTSAQLQAQTLRDQLTMQQRNFDKEMAFNYEQLRRNSESNQKNRDLQAFEVLTRTPNFNYW